MNQESPKKEIKATMDDFIKLVENDNSLMIPLQLIIKERELDEALAKIDELEKAGKEVVEPVKE